MLHRHLRAAVLIMGLAACGCGSGPITAARLEADVAPTFANLVRIQVDWLALPPMTAAEFQVTATCRRLVAGDAVGSGEWSCTIRWRTPDRRIQQDLYELFVMTDGCYTATAGVELGGPMLKTPDGREVRNLLYAFDGCFDTT
jgi:hypothetical protein